jgi:RNA polymerase sigma factor (sigma-70 family)
MIAREVPDADAASFQAVRPRLFGIAYRVLASAPDADDVVQEAWIRWQRSDRDAVRDVDAFLAATTLRLAINVIQSARVRHETQVEVERVEPVDPGADPAGAVERADTLEHALRALQERLSPAERAAYVLREAFDYPYREIADVLALSEVNARQLVTRARRDLCREHRRPVDATQHRRLHDAFRIAATAGRLRTLEHVLVAAKPGRGARSAAERRRRDARVPVHRRDPHRQLVREAPRPVLARLDRADDRVAAGAGVGGRVAHGRVVAAPDVAALEADPQVQPLRAGGQALGAAVHRLRQLGDPDVLEVRASGRHSRDGRRA